MIIVQYICKLLEILLLHCAFTVEVGVKGLDVWIVEIGDGFDEAANDVSKVLWLGRVMLHAVREVVDGFLDVFLIDTFVSRISPSYKCKELSTIDHSISTCEIQPTIMLLTIWSVTGLPVRTCSRGMNWSPC